MHKFDQFTRIKSIPVHDVNHDPRIDFRVLQELKRLGFNRIAEPNILYLQPLEVIRSEISLCEPLIPLAYRGYYLNLPEIQSFISTRTERIKSYDDYMIELAIHSRTENDVNVDTIKSTKDPKPCVLHFHGGGMAMGGMHEVQFERFRHELAMQDLVVIGVEFRNSCGKLGPFPFPCGLKDCMKSLEYVYQHKAEWNISSIIVCGESGGGNLALALPLFAREHGCLHYIDGVYSICPMISNLYTDIDTDEFRSLSSLTDNNGMNLNLTGLASIALLYDPTLAHARDPLAWPFWATLDMLKDLPPHVISVNELDPLCSEGIAYYRKLQAANKTAFMDNFNTVLGGPLEDSRQVRITNVHCKMNIGFTHCADVFHAPLRDVLCRTVTEITEFARNCRESM